MTSVISISEMRSALEKRRMESYISSTTVLEKCVALCVNYRHSIADFLPKLEAFMLNCDDASLSIDKIGQFEQSLYAETRNRQSVLEKKSQSDSRSEKKKISPSPEVSSLGKRSKFDFVTPNDNKPPTKSVDSFIPSVTPATVKKDFSGDLESSLSQAPGIAYSQRPNQGQSIQTYNPNLGERGAFEPSKSKPLGMRCRLETNDADFESISGRYRYMYTTLDERARSLDKHLLKLQDQLCLLADIPEGGLHPVGIPSQETVWVCGRICCEAPDGRINKASIVLEGSRRDSAGRRVHLDVEQVQSYSLFPGQIVLVEGVNSSGRKMVAKRIVEGVAIPGIQTSVKKLLEFHHSPSYQGGAPLHVITAAGPFTTSDNLDYKPLCDLLMKVLETKPDVLILMGPFVDITQPLLSSGHVELPNADYDEDGEHGVSDISMHEASYEMVFIEKIVRDCIRTLFESEMDYGGPLPTHIVLVPSLLDAHHEFVFPQPPFGDRKAVTTTYFDDELGILNIPYSSATDPKRRVHLMPNPCMFRVNEVLFGVCSNDTLFSLSSDEVSRNIEGNRLARLAGHLLQQQSFSPQFPVPSTLLSQYDLRHSRHWEFKAQPDILLLPSKLAVLAKEVFGTLVVNPGPLSRGVGGGTFADMTVHPFKESDLRSTLVSGTLHANSGQSTNTDSGSNEVMLSNKVFSRTAVKIVKI